MDHQQPVADVFVVMGPVEPSGTVGQIRGFILDKGMKGLSAPAIHGKGGPARLDHRRDRDGRRLRARGERLPEVRGPKGPFTCLNSARFGIAWGAMGAAEACWHTARQYTLDRSSSAGRWPPTS